MRRRVAIAIALAVVIVVIGLVLLKPANPERAAPTPQAFLVLYEQAAEPPAPTQTEFTERQKWNERDGAFVGKIAHDCGVSRSEFIVPTDSLGQLWIPLSVTPKDALGCVRRKMDEQHLQYAIKDRATQ